VNGYAYVEKKGGKYTLFPFKGNRPSDSLLDLDFKALIMSRMDFDVKVIEIPSIPEREIEGFLKYRIRSLYPGHPEDTVFDYSLFTIAKKKKSAILFLCRKEVLEEYKKISNGNHLLLPFTLMRPFITGYFGKAAIFSFWYNSWIDILVFTENEKVDSFVIKRAEKLSLDMNQIIKMLTGHADEFNWVIFCSEQEKELIKEMAAGLVDKNTSVEVFPIQDALNRINRKTNYLFAEKKKKRLINQKLRIQLLCIIVLFIFALLFKKTVDWQQRYLIDLETSIGSLAKQTTEVVSLQNEIEAMEEELNSLKEKIPMDVYFILSELEPVLTKDTRVQSFILEKNFFQLEAIGRNPLGLMERFKEKKVFTNVKLLQIVPLKNSDKELFKISGRVDVK
jgi:cell division protein FtsB